MHILIISDAYPPMRTSCATQIYDLAQAFIEQGHQVSIIIPAHSQKKVVEISNTDGPTVYSVRCFKTKDVGYARRTIAEFINPFAIGFHLKRNSSFIGQKIDGIAWYSPTIFWGPLVKRLKEQFKCRAYLILRDIFPDWANDLEIIRNKFVLSLFKFIANYQYELADKIGVQSPNNIIYLSKNYPLIFSKLEVLWNWVGVSRSIPSSIQINQTILSGKYIFIYSGNLGVAQGADQFLDLIKIFKDKSDVGFIFVGRGSERLFLQEELEKIHFKNALFFDEVDPDELPNLYKQCHAGLVVLDPRHKTHNIPGKFLGYIQYGLPVIGFVNPGNDLLRLVQNWNVGILSSNYSTDFLSNLNKIQFGDMGMKRRCRELVNSLFSPSRAAEQIEGSLLNSLPEGGESVQFDNSQNVSNNFSKLDDIGNNSALYKENSLRVLNNPSLIRHFEPSLICSADDDSRPNQYLIDLAVSGIQIASRESIENFDVAISDSIFFNVFPGEHYRLLKALTKILNPEVVVEIGTYTGMGTLSISQGMKTGLLHTFDIFPWDSMMSHLNANLMDGTKITQHLSDLSLDGQFEKYKEILDQADLIFLDAPKDGVFEYKILDLFQSLKPKEGRLLIIDDIRFINMIELWRGIKSPKLDVTSFGHWSGTGLVDLS